MQLEFDSVLEDIKPAPKPTEDQLQFDFYDRDALHWNSFTFSPVQLLNWSPSKTVTFNHDNRVCGTFSWEDGTFKFTGEAETSARIFADYVGKFLGFKKQDLTT